MVNSKYKLNFAIGDEDKAEVEKIKKGVQLHIKMNKLKGSSIARFDSKTRRPYLEFPDGRREYADEC